MEKNNILKIWRVKNGYTSRWVASQMGVSLGNYNEVECLKRPGSAKFWIKFQKAFNVDTETILILQGAYYGKVHLDSNENATN